MALALTVDERTELERRTRSRRIRVEDARRAQVILIVTGLGALTLEEVFPGVMAQPAKSPEPLPVQQSSALPTTPASYTPAPTYPQAPRYSDLPPLTQSPSEPMTQSVPNMHANNLDIPAFLRRRMRANNPPTPGFSS